MAASTSTTEDSRERLVRAAVELVLEHFAAGTGLRDVFAYLTPRAIADRAGVSRGLIYHHWGAPDADGSATFGAFLEAVSDEIWTMSAVPEDLTLLSDFLPDNVSDLVRELTSYELERVTGPDGPLWRASEVLVLHGVRPQHEAEHVVERLAGLYEVVLAKIGREPVPPLDHEDLALAVSCVFSGFSTQIYATPDRLWAQYDWSPFVEPSLRGDGWTLLAITVESMVLRMTRPVGG